MRSGDGSGRLQDGLPPALVRTLSGVLIAAAAAIVIGTSALLYRMEEGSAAAGGQVYLGLLGLVAYGWVVGLLLRVRRRDPGAPRGRVVLAVALATVLVLAVFAAASALGPPPGAPPASDPR